MAKRSRHGKLRRAIASPKDADSIIWIFLGAIIFGFASGIGSALGTKFVDKSASRVGDEMKKAAAAQRAYYARLNA